MPIDWTALANAFRLPLRSQTSPLALAFQRLGLMLQKRLRAAQNAERMTRLFPVIGFRGDAVRVYVDRSQHGSLTGPPGSSPSLSSSGRAFVSGLGVVPNAVRESTLIMRLMGALVNFVHQVEAAVNRSVPPTPDIFDPRHRTGMDIFGAAGLLVWGTATGLRQIHTLTRGLRAWKTLEDAPERARLQRSIDRIAPGVRPAAASRETAAGGAASSAESELSLAEKLDVYTHYLLGSVLALPLLGDWLERALRAVDIRLRLMIVSGMGRVVTFLFGMRRSIANLIGVTLPEYARQAFGIALIMARNIIETLDILVIAVTVIGDYLRDSFGLFFRRLSFVVNLVIDIFNGLVGLFRSFMNFDLMTIILPVLGLPSFLIGTAPSLTIGDLVEAGLQGGIILARGQLETWLATAELAVYGMILPGNLRRRILDKIAQVRAVVRAAVVPMAPLPPPPRSPVLPTFPNLYDLAFGGPQTADLFNALRTSRERLAVEVPALFQSGAEALADASILFHRRALAEAQVGSVEQYRTLSEQAVEMADTVFGSQVRQAQGRLDTQRPDAVAGAFERWLINSGFETVGQAIPMYVDHLMRFWRQQTSETPAEDGGPLPTSPHILERHRRVGTVRTNRMTLRIPAAPLDDGLAEQIAAGFRQAVADAYASGVRQLANEAG